MSPAIQEYFTAEEIALLRLQLREGTEAAQAAAKKQGWKMNDRLVALARERDPTPQSGNG